MRIFSTSAVSVRTASPDLANLRLERFDLPGQFLALLFVNSAWARRRQFMLDPAAFSGHRGGGLCYALDLLGQFSPGHGLALHLLPASQLLLLHLPQLDALRWSAFRWIPSILRQAAT